MLLAEIYIDTSYVDNKLRWITSNVVRRQHTMKIKMFIGKSVLYSLNVHMEKVPV